MTLESSWKKLPNSLNSIADTPGLEDISTRNECARQIFLALKASMHDEPGFKNFSKMKILFIMKLQAGRFHAADITSLNVILKALPNEVKYNLVVNQIPPNTYKDLLVNEDAQRILVGAAMSQFIYLPSSVSFIPICVEAMDQKNYILKNQNASVWEVRDSRLHIVHEEKTLKEWTSILNYAIYEKEKVKELVVADYAKVTTMLEEQMKALREENKKLKEELLKMNENFIKQRERQKAHEDKLLLQLTNDINKQLEIQQRENNMAIKKRQIERESERKRIEQERKKAEQEKRAMEEKWRKEKEEDQIKYDELLALIKKDKKKGEKDLEKILRENKERERVRSEEKRNQDEKVVRDDAYFKQLKLDMIAKEAEEKQAAENAQKGSCVLL